MQCPKCQMNIKDGSAFCIHCGTQFNNPVPTQTVVTSTFCPNCKANVQANAQFCTACGAKLNNNTQGTQTVQTNEPKQILVDDGDDFEKYLRAYLGHKYDSIKRLDFSFGTFFFGWVWLLANRLYSMAGKLLLTFMGIDFAVTILASIIGIPGLFVLIDLGAKIYFLIQYGGLFATAYSRRANNEISEILNTTQNEEERIEKCKKAGRNIAGIIIVGAIILIFVIIVLVVFLAIFGAAYDSVNNTKKDVFEQTARAYTNSIRNLAVSDELICNEEVFSKTKPGIYYYSFTTKYGSSAADIMDTSYKSPWENADIAGQVYIYKSKENNSYSSLDYAVVLVDSEGRGIGSFSSDGKPVSVKSIVNLSRTDVIEKNAQNRKKYYDKASLGTKKALTVDTAPTLETNWDQLRFGDLSIEGNKTITTQPISCEIAE